MSESIPKNVVEYLVRRIEDNDIVTIILNDGELITIDDGYYSISCYDGCTFDYPAFDDIYVTDDNLILVSQLGWFESVMRVPLEQIIDFQIE